MPILKRKDTERTQARLQAGLAGMEELRVLREHQQQLIGDTMARVENRQQRRHSTPRLNGDDGLVTSAHPKMSKSTGQVGDSFVSLFSVLLTLTCRYVYVCMCVYRMLEIG